MTKTIKIKNADGETIYECEAKTLWEAFEIAVRAGVDLRGENLQYANLQYANLQGANLRGANLDFAAITIIGTARCGPACRVVWDL